MFLIRVQALRDPLRGELPHVQIFMNDGPPTRSREIPSCSAVDLAEIRRSSKISSWIWSLISGVVIVWCRPGWDEWQVEKSPSFWWRHKMMHVQPNVSVRMSCLAENKTLWQLVFPCCWNRARRLTCFLSTFVTRKYLQFGTWTDPSFQRHYLFRPTTFGIRSG